MAQPKKTRICDLTPRELEVLRLIADGHTSKEIAQRLGISFKTVVTHKTHLMEKLKVRSAVLLTRRALELGLVELRSAE